MVKALVTGGTGFVGAQVARELIGAGHTVRVLRRARSPLELIGDLPVEHAIGDIMDPDSLACAMQGCAWVFHVAAVSDYWRSDRLKVYMVNVNGTQNVLEAAREAGVQRMIFTSSCAAVGVHQDGRPANEADLFNLKPGRFPYGHSKFLADQLVARAVERGQDIVTVSPAVVFGPGDLNLGSGAMFKELSSWWVPIYAAGGVTVIDVRDVARVHLAAAERGRTGERYLLGAENVTNRHIFEQVAGLVGMPPPVFRVPRFVAPAVAAVVGVLRRIGVPIPADPDQIRQSAFDLYFDCSKAWRELGRPQIPFRQSLEDAYRWYVEHGLIRARSVTAN
jgi:dihydroflavonol-4-reductase